MKSLRDVLEKLPDSAHLTFVGDGPYRRELEEHFAGCRVTFTVRACLQSQCAHVTDHKLGSRIIDCLSTNTHRYTIGHCIVVNDQQQQSHQQGSEW